MLPPDLVGVLARFDPVAALRYACACRDNWAARTPQLLFLAALNAKSPVPDWVFREAPRLAFYVPRPLNVDPDYFFLDFHDEPVQRNPKTLRNGVIVSSRVEAHRLSSRFWLDGQLKSTGAYGYIKALLATNELVCERIDICFVICPDTLTVLARREFSSFCFVADQRTIIGYNSTQTVVMNADLSTRFTLNTPRKSSLMIRGHYFGYYEPECTEVKIHDARTGTLLFSTQVADSGFALSARGHLFLKRKSTVEIYHVDSGALLIQRPRFMAADPRFDSQGRRLYFFCHKHAWVLDVPQM